MRASVEQLLTGMNPANYYRRTHTVDSFLVREKLINPLFVLSAWMSPSIEIRGARTPINIQIMVFILKYLPWLKYLRAPSPVKEREIQPLYP